MTWNPGLVRRRLLQGFGLGGAIFFSLPGGAVLCELFWQAGGARPGMWPEVVLALAAALLVTAWLFSPRRIVSSAGWAIAVMGHAALANSISPGRGINEQLAWLGVGAALGAVVGPCLLRRQSRETAATRHGVEGTGVVAPPCSPGRFQITLPMLGFWAVALAVLWILLARDHERVAWQDRVSRAVLQSRGHILFDDFGVPTLVFPWRTCRPEDEAETHKSLRCIELGARAGDEQLAQLFGLGLKDLPNLNEMRLDRSQVTDNGLVIVMPLVRLEGLSLGPATTNSGLRHLNGLVALKTLDLSGTQITGEGLRFPRQLPDLQILALRHTRIGDDDLAQLRRFPGLINLDLTGTQISDAGLAYLTSLPKLQSLRLERTHVSDAGIEHLNKMPRLRWLFASHTRITDAGLKTLWSTRPEVAVVR